MARSLAWHLNLDADRELQDPAAYRAPNLSAARVRELVARMADLVAPEDSYLDALPAGALPAELTIQTFCPTPSALARIRARGFLPPSAPPLGVLRAVNDRAFCAALGHGLPDACFARDLAQLEAHVRRPTAGGWYVIKRAFSFAGREQKRVQPGALDDATRSFCLRSFARGEGLQVEPWVARLADFARHAYLTRKGALLLGATREQRCDAQGRFLGMCSGPAQASRADDAALLAELHKTADALTAAGYFGPFGIDAFRYLRTDDSVSFNARCEINARLTMGYPRALLLDGLAHDA
jgi:hypothetical protein